MVDMTDTGATSRQRMWILTDVSPYRAGPAGVHGVLPQARVALSELAEMAGLTPVLSDAGSLAPEDFSAGSTGSTGSAGSPVGVLALFTIGETPFTPDQRSAVVDAWRAGRLGILGVHAATDACHGWPEYGEMLGGRFGGHPWTRPFDVEVAEAAHPATAHLPDPWAWHDELYLFDELRPDARVLLRLGSDDLDLSVPGARTPDCGFPLAWCIEQPGRTFYTALGHFPQAWETPTYLRHLAGGLAWLLAG